MIGWLSLGRERWSSFLPAWIANSSSCSHFPVSLKLREAYPGLLHRFIAFACSQLNRTARVLDPSHTECARMQREVSGVHRKEPPALTPDSKNDELLVAGFGRKGYAVGDIPGVRFMIAKDSNTSLIALFKGKK